MKRITKNEVRVSLAVVILAISIVLLGLVPINAGFLKDPLARAVREATGFQLGIRDPTIVRLGLNPRVTSNGFAFGDPADSPLLSVDTLRVQLGLLPMLSGGIHIRSIVADGIG